jgi:enoyl-CoA hydratase/carnithine racemase
MVQKDFEYIIFNIEDNVGVITLNRPKRLNALNYPLLMEIIDILELNSKNKIIRAFTI